MTGKEMELAYEQLTVRAALANDLFLIVIILLSIAFLLVMLVEKRSKKSSQEIRSKSLRISS